MLLRVNGLKYRIFCEKKTRIFYMERVSKRAWNLRTSAAGGQYSPIAKGGFGWLSPPNKAPIPLKLKFETL